MTFPMMITHVYYSGANYYLPKAGPVLRTQAALKQTTLVLLLIGLTDVGIALTCPQGRLIHRVTEPRQSRALRFEVIATSDSDVTAAPGPTVLGGPATFVHGSVAPTPQFPTLEPVGPTPELRTSVKDQRQSEETKLGADGRSLNHQDTQIKEAYALMNQLRQGIAELEPVQDLSLARLAIERAKSSWLNMRRIYCSGVHDGKYIDLEGLEQSCSQADLNRQ